MGKNGQQPQSNWIEETRKLLTEMGVLESNGSGTQIASIPADMIGWREGESALPRLVTKSWLETQPGEREQIGTLPIKNDQGEDVPVFAQKQANPWDNQAKRAEVSGISAVDGEFTPAEELVAYKDDPAAWGDFLRYRLPMQTKETTLASIRQLPQFADEYDAGELAALQSRLTARMFEHLAPDPTPQPDPAPAQGNAPAQSSDPTPAGLQAKQADDVGAGDEGDPGGDGGEDPGATGDTGAGDPDDAVWGSMVDLALAFVSAARGLDQLAEQTTDNGKLDPGQWKGLIGQLTTGLNRLYDQLDSGDEGDMGEEQDVVQKMMTLITKDLAPDLSEEYQRLRELQTKAGARHSKNDQSHLEKIHQGVTDLGYDGCLPKFGKKKGDDAPPKGMQKKSATLSVTPDTGTTASPTPNAESVNHQEIQALIDQALTPMRAELTRVQGAGEQASSEVARLHDELQARDEQVDTGREERQTLLRQLAERDEALQTKNAEIAQLRQKLDEPLPGVLDRSRSTGQEANPVSNHPLKRVSGKPEGLARPIISTNFGTAIAVEDDE